MLGGITASLTGREGFPDNVILSSGYHDFPHSADLRRQPGGSHADAHNVFPSTGSGVTATALAAEKRREGVLEVMDHLAKATGNASRLWYRSNYCQDHFSALVADARVVPAVQQGGGSVLDVLSLSSAYWTDQIPDGLVPGREPMGSPTYWQNPDKYAHHAGELSSQTAQLVLSRVVCAAHAN